jgi:hypothetical protein
MKLEVPFQSYPRDGVVGEKANFHRKTSHRRSVNLQQSTKREQTATIESHIRLTYEDWGTGTHSSYWRNSCNSELYTRKMK